MFSQFSWILVGSVTHWVKQKKISGSSRNAIRFYPRIIKKSRNSHCDFRHSHLKACVHGLKSCFWNRDFAESIYSLVILRRSLNRSNYKIFAVKQFLLKNKAKSKFNHLKDWWVEQNKSQIVVIGKKPYRYMTSSENSWFLWRKKSRIVFPFVMWFLRDFFVEYQIFLLYFHDYGEFWYCFVYIVL